MPTLARVSLATDQLPFEVGKGPRLGPYYLIRSEDTLATLKNPLAPDIFDRLKFIPIDLEKRVYVTLSYEQRARYESFSTTQLGLRKQGRQNLLSFREGLGADLHLGTHFRIFGSFQSGEVGGAGYGKPAPANRDDLAIIQAFAEAFTTQSGITAGLRVGRQQMVLGNGLLFALRDNTNIQQTYDGIRAYIDDDRVRADAFYLDNVVNRYGVLADGANAHQAYWGLYASLAVPETTAFIDPFYVGTVKRRTVFNGRVGGENRSSFGARAWGSIGQADLDTTCVLQDGTQAGHAVSAFAVFSGAGYSFVNTPLAPRLGMHIDVASGGRRPGGALHTYDPLNYSVIYTSEMPVLTASNLVRVGMGLSASILPKLRVQAIAAAFWRTAQDDFLYNVVGAPLPRTNLARGSFVGFEPALRVAWSIDRHLTMVSQVAFLDISQPLRDVGAKSEGYVSTYLLFRI